jgi:branched-chain amino acid transport system ATP-binding protein
VTKWRPSAIAAAGLGRSFQHPPLLEHETVADNVVCGMHGLDKYSLASQVFRPRHVARREALLYERALLLLDVVGLSDLADHAVGSLSYGQRKLIDIARAMASGPRLLLLDEPTSGLDFAEQEKVKNILLTLRASGRVTVLVVEHHMDMVRNTATRVLGLQAGAVLAEGDPGQVLDSEAFRQAVVGR